MVSLPVRGTREGFPWTAQFMAIDSTKNIAYYFDGEIMGDRAWVSDIKQDHPFKWGVGDKLIMYALYVHE
jgi:hypothetical protein